MSRSRLFKFSLFLSLSFSALSFGSLVPHTPSGAEDSGPIMLISDIDDTIKESYVDDVGYNIYHALNGAPAFPGMATLYTAMPTTRGAVAVSGGPQFFEDLSQWTSDFLNQNHFPFSDFFLKPSLFDNTKTFKSKVLQQLAADHEDTRFILVGDDTEKDPAVYHEFHLAHPNRVVAIYIHIVNGKQKLPKDLIPYYTALDLAQDEFLADRLEAEAFLRVGEELLEASEDVFLPEFSACPSERSLVGGWFLNDLRMRAMRDAVDARIRTLCKKRYANPNWRRFYER